ncbi:cytochrome c biogenesis protein ResB, partial [Pseudomonas aeruginosa]
MTLDRFDVTYVPPGQPGSGQARDFAANVTTLTPDGQRQEGQVRVNHPL